MRHLPGNSKRIQTVAGRRDRIGVDVGCEYLQLGAHVGGIKIFLKQHGQRISLLPRATPHDPDTNRLSDLSVAHNARDDFGREEFEYVLIPEKGRDVDQQVRGQIINLLRVAFKKIEVIPHTRHADAAHRHPPFDAAGERAGLVKPEVVRGPAPQELDDFG